MSYTAPDLADDVEMALSNAGLIPADADTDQVAAAAVKAIGMHNELLNALLDIQRECKLQKPNINILRLLAREAITKATEI